MPILLQWRLFSQLRKRQVVDHLVSAVRDCQFHTSVLVLQVLRLYATCATWDRAMTTNKHNLWALDNLRAPWKAGKILPAWRLVALLHKVACNHSSLFSLKHSMFTLTVRLEIPGWNTCSNSDYPFVLFFSLARQILGKIHKLRNGCLLPNSLLTGILPLDLP